ncbi:MAG: aminopeptidase [Desulfobacteraceae bacterium]|nr:MAG: aminopeptidase [Desulfobacteraceae bacterium]
MNKAQIKALQKKTVNEDQLAFDHLSKSEQKACFGFCDQYKQFLDRAKTEREAVREIIELAEKQGFTDIDKHLASASKRKSVPRKVYKTFKDKCVALAVLGKDNLESGTRIIASHIDSPRLDLKQNPLYEDLDLGLLKTHYYGGIRKYQWLAIPLALHGTILNSKGERIEITIGEDPDDPVFTVSDLLPHLAGKLQNNKKLSEVFDAEKLNLIAGSLPLGEPSTKDRFMLNILSILNSKYNIVEEDLISAEIEAVPAGSARDIGFDRSMIGAYGQDDRVCAYTSLMALLDTTTRPEKTGICFFFDKEEIGSEGNTGAKSVFIEDFISDLLVLNKEAADNRTLRKVLIASQCLSADVNAAMDPDYKEVHEKLNAAKLGHGICMTKFTGVGGKSGSSDASAEFVGIVREIFNQKKVIWQTGELGKTDQGGGGTVAKFMAQLGMDVLDCGPALLSMHAPFEISSKPDVYMTYKGYKAFFS